MSNSLTDKCGDIHVFKFHGQGSSFFVICLVNTILSIITCGIFLPWAFVRSRRYIYENIELNGARFHYHAKGSAIFLSWLAITIIIGLLCGIEFFITHSEEIVFAPWAFILLTPFLMVKSLNYHAAMTTLNNVRFGFQCSMLRAWWVMLGMPVLVLLLLLILIIGYNNVLGFPSSLSTMIIRLISECVIGLIAVTILNGVVYRNWITLFAKNSQFGIHHFNINIKFSKCIIITLISMAILVPFLVVIARVIMVQFNSMMSSALSGIAGGTLGVFTLVYLLYLVGILISSAYAFTALRNYAFNNLTLAGNIRFCSSLTFISMTINFLLLTFVSMITLGLAYPWLKIRYLRYQAEHTFVLGDLDALELKNDECSLDSGIFARISRGFAPALPFL